MAAPKKNRKQAMQTQREVRGIILIALGIFLGFCMYFEAAGIIGEAITALFFGLTGLFAYALPPVLLIGGILMIAHAGARPQKGRTALIVFGILLVLTFIHTIARPILGEANFIFYIRDAYTYGHDFMQGGGALGALLCYPILLLAGQVGAYIFLIAGILIILLLVTRLSLREAGQNLGRQVKTTLQTAGEHIATKRQALYLEDLDPACTPVPQPRPRGKARRRMADHPDDDLTFMPTGGLLKRKSADADMLDDEILTEDDMPIAITYYDEGKAVSLPDEFVATPLRTANRTARASMDAPAPPLTVRQSKFAASIHQEPEDAFPPAVQTDVPLPYVPPSFSLLNPAAASYGRSTESPAENGRLLIETLESFNVAARIVNISVGPVITRYELAPAPGVRVNRITALSDDIALALAAPRVRIEAPIPGKAAIGIEVPNKDTATVVLRDIVDSKEFASAKSPITLALGKDIAGKVIVADLAKMPHLLIAGATGAGKSVCINNIVISLTYKCSPQELELILVDPKVVELSVFGTLPHLKVPVVTDPKKAAGALASGVREMTERYKKFAQIGARDLERYNELQPENKLPKLVIIIDELADLMMVAPDTVEDSICRIAQLGRAAGIHLIVATQRPSADVITGLIKANIPSRIAFAVSSAIDSRIILDSSGAEKLLGRGDMLFHPNGSGKPIRVQGAYVGDEEVERVVLHFQNQALAPTFDEQMIEDMDAEEQASGGAQGNGKQEDELLGEAVRIVLDSGQASISMIQRRLRVGYARAARLVDIMEQHGFVSGFDGSKPRKLLITRAQYEQIFTNQQAADGEEDDIV